MRSLILASLFVGASSFVAFPVYAQAHNDVIVQTDKLQKGRIIMSEHDFSQLYERYPSLIEQMPETFTSHTFILSLAQQNQALYIEALYSYHEKDEPFRIVHSILSRHLNNYPEVIAKTGEAESDNIFGQKSRCEHWRKI